jgi:hypothetical protein
MKLGWIGAGVLTFAAFSAGGMKAYIDATGGEGTTKAAFEYGTGSASESLGEVARVPAQVGTDLKPAFNDMKGLTGGFMGATTTTAANWDQPVDPNAAGGQD